VTEILFLYDEQPEDKPHTLYNRRLIEILSVLASVYMLTDSETDLARQGGGFL
jgi:hypothetical protein